MILKLKRTPGIYLVGFMGCGKTTVGQALAKRLGWRFRDCDNEIEATVGMRITEIFDQRGEREFRRLEAEAIAACVRQIEGGHPTVFALGGGAFAQKKNRALVTANGISIWLDCPLDVLKQRVSKETHRPLAKDTRRFEKLYHSRVGAYEQADFRVDASMEDPQPIVQQILSLPIF